MRKLLIGGATAALALGACDVNVTSNDARTQQALNQAQDTLGDLGNGAGELAQDAGNTLSNAAGSASNEVQDLGNRVGNMDVDINSNSAAGNRQ